MTGTPAGEWPMRCKAHAGPAKDRSLIRKLEILLRYADNRRDSPPPPEIFFCWGVVAALSDCYFSPSATSRSNPPMQQYGVMFAVIVVGVFLSQPLREVIDKLTAINAALHEIRRHLPT